MFANICLNFIQADQELRTEIEKLLKMARTVSQSKNPEMPYRSGNVIDDTESDEEINDEAVPN